MYRHTARPSSAVPSEKFSCPCFGAAGGSIVGLARPHEELWSP